MDIEDFIYLFYNKQFWKFSFEKDKLGQRHRVDASKMQLFVTCRRGVVFGIIY